jgi:hypothetical protein
MAGQPPSLFFCLAGDVEIAEKLRGTPVVIREKAINSFLPDKHMTCP